MKKISGFVYLVIFVVVIYNIYLINQNANLKKDYDYMVLKNREITSEGEEKKDIDFAAISDIENIDDLDSIYLKSDELSLNFSFDEKIDYKKILDDVRKNLDFSDYSQILDENHSSDKQNLMTIKIYGDKNE